LTSQNLFTLLQKLALLLLPPL